MKAEFTEGEIIVHSPIRVAHGECGENLFIILKLFIKRHNLGWVGYEKYPTRFSRNDYEPDISFPKSDKITEDQTIIPIQDFIVEILSKSTEERERGIKKLDYQQHRVKEYRITDADAKLIEKYLPYEYGEYDEPEIYGIKDKIPCHVIEGLEIPLKAIFNSDENLSFIQKIVS